MPSQSGHPLQNLRRHVMSYIITYYLPSGLFVVVSWISFLIPADIVPGETKKSFENELQGGHKSTIFRSHGPPDHPVPGPDQHLQQHHDQLAKGRGTHGNRDLVSEGNIQIYPSNLPQIRPNVPTFLTPIFCLPFRMLACILFVFGTLIEYAAILYQKQKRCKYGAPSQSAYSVSAANAAAQVKGYRVGKK